MADGKDPADLRVAIIFLRAVRGWDQGELAAASGVSASTISRCESGEAAPSAKTFEQIVAAVGVPASTLERLFAVIRSARAAMSHAAWPEEPAGDVDAIAASAGDRFFDIARAAASLVFEQASNRKKAVE
ncbi:MAG TPA: helix-turn-helix transcriptional regulator [Thermoanaerobaculia bacterium]|jgi:transcriptional regulator with XRE-family HTH domain